MRLIKVVLAFGLLASYLACGQSVTPAVSPDLRLSRDTVIELPIHDFTSLEPLLYTNSDSTYIVNFWATWCAPCVKELPYFEDYLSQHEGEKTAVVLVSLDFPEYIEDRLLPFLNQRKIYRSEVLLLDAPDANSWIGRVEPSWTGAIPATLIFNRDTSVFIGEPFDDLADLEAAVISISN